MSAKIVRQKISFPESQYFDLFCYLDFDLTSLVSIFLYQFSILGIAKNLDWMHRFIKKKTTEHTHNN